VGEIGSSPNIGLAFTSEITLGRISLFCEVFIFFFYLWFGNHRCTSLETCLLPWAYM